MAADKKPQFPPAEQPHHLSRSCCCCLFGIFWKLLATILVIAALAILIFWLVVQPRAFKFCVSEVNLITQFDYPNNTLLYDLVVNFTARNPNKKLTIYYDKVQARAFYADVRFATADVINHLNSFRQYTKSSDPMSVHLSGQEVILMNQSEFVDENKRSGSLNIDVRLYLSIRFRVGNFITPDFKPKVRCDLDVPLTSSTTATTTAVAGFQPTNCHVHF